MPTLLLAIDPPSCWINHITAHSAPEERGTQGGGGLGGMCSPPRPAGPGAKSMQDPQQSPINLEPDGRLHTLLSAIVGNVLKHTD